MNINFRGVSLDVDFSYSPPQRGMRDEWGAPLEPDYDAEIDINTISLDGKDITELCEAAGIMSEVETLVWQGMADEVADYD